MMNAQRSWDLQIDPDVFKILKRIVRRDAEVILEIIHLLPALSEGEYRESFIKKIRMRSQSQGPFQKFTGKESFFKNF